MSNEKEIWMETTHGRKSKCKTEFKAVVNKVLVSTLILTTILGTTTPAFAASMPQNNNVPQNQITQQYGISVEQAVREINNTISTINFMKSQGKVSEATLKNLAQQLYTLETSVRASGKGVTTEVKSIIANAEKSIQGLSNANDAQIAIAIVKANLGIDSVTVVNKQATLKSFRDVASNRWSYKSIMLCVQHGAIAGTKTPDANGVGEFNPTGTVTVGQFITVLTRLVASDHIGGTAGEGEHWAMPNYNAAVTSGMIRKTDFTPSELNNPISREDMAFLLVKAAELNGETLEAHPKAASVISDYNKISPDRKGYVTQCYSNGLIAGYSDGSFGYADTMTREQMATVVCRLMEYQPRSEVKFEEEKAPVVQNGAYFYESGMVKTETQIAVVKDNFDNIRLYKNGNGELCVDVSAVSLPKELADAGWKISLAVLPLEKGSGLPMDANGDFMLSSGQTASKVITIGSAMHGTEEAIKVSDFNKVMITMSLYHKDHTKSDSAMRFKSVSDNTSVITGVYVNGSQNMKNENINMNVSSVYSGLK